MKETLCRLNVKVTLEKINAYNSGYAKKKTMIQYSIILLSKAIFRLNIRIICHFKNGLSGIISNSENYQVWLLFSFNQINIRYNNLICHTVITPQHKHKVRRF